MACSIKAVYQNLLSHPGLGQATHESLTPPFNARKKYCNDLFFRKGPPNTMFFLGWDHPTRNYIIILKKLGSKCDKRFFKPIKTCFNHIKTISICFNLVAILFPSFHLAFFWIFGGGAQHAAKNRKKRDKRLFDHIKTLLKPY